MSDSKENVDVLKMYGEDSTTKRDEFLKKHNLNEKGLTSKQAEINIKKFGLNETKKAKPKKWYNYLLQSLLTPFNCILIGISIILIYTDIFPIVVVAQNSGAIWPIFTFPFIINS